MQTVILELITTKPNTFQGCNHWNLHKTHPTSTCIKITAFSKHRSISLAAFFQYRSIQLVAFKNMQWHILLFAWHLFRMWIQEKKQEQQEETEAKTVHVKPSPHKLPLTVGEGGFISEVRGRVTAGCQVRSMWGDSWGRALCYSSTGNLGMARGVHLLLLLLHLLSSRHVQMTQIGSL